MRIVSLITALLILLTAPFWGSLLAGLLAGLWHQRVYAGLIRQRGLWLLLQWPFRQLWWGWRWLFDWGLRMNGVLLAGAGLCAMLLLLSTLIYLYTLIYWLTDAPAPVGHARFVQGLVEIPGAGQIAWQLGDTDAVIRNNQQDALKCSLDQQSLYGSSGLALIQRGAVIEISAEMFLGGVYCGALHATDYKAGGIRVGPVP
jgi:hypothetical protein